MPTNTKNAVKRGRGRPPKANKLQSLEQLNGKVETRQTIKQINSLDEVWGAGNGNDKYGTLDEAEYISRLRQMGEIDIVNHARQHGVMFTLAAGGNYNPYERLRDLLLKQFRIYVASFSPPAQSATQQMSKKATKELEEQVKAILSPNRLPKS